MKKLFTILLLIICNQKISSQIYYSNYLDETSEWKTLRSDASAGGRRLYFETLFFNGFENIDGYTYYKMFQTSFNIMYDWSYTNILIPQSSDFTFLRGYFREDATGKFYFKSIGTNEIITFDNQELINLALGDNITFYGLNCQSQVNEISTINISGRNSKAIFSNTNLMLGSSAIEGVGLTKNSCALGPGDGTSVKTIYCYSKQNETIQFFDNNSTIGCLMPQTQIDCNSFPTANRQNLNSNNNNLQNVTIYPNPTNDFINIDLGYNFKDSEINLYDLQGRLLLGTLSQSKINKIDLSNYQKGTYLVKIKTNEGQKTIKILKN